MVDQPHRVWNVETIWKGKKGHYWVEAKELGDGGFRAFAVGPAPGPVGPIASADASSKDEAVRLVIAKLQLQGA